MDVAVIVRTLPARRRIHGVGSLKRDRYAPEFNANFLTSFDG